MRPYGERTSRGICHDTRWPRRTRKTFGKWRDRISTETHRNERRTIKKRARQEGKQEASGRTRETSRPSSRRTPTQTFRLLLEQWESR